MKNFLISYYHWGDLLGMAVLFAIGYFALKIIQLGLNKYVFGGAWHSILLKIMHIALLIFLPASILILISIFILINPPLHSLLIFLILLLGYSQFKNFVTGRFIKFDQSLTKGKRLCVGNQEGVVYDLEQFGIQLQTKKGKHFVGYSKMFTKGYTILSGGEVGSIIQLSITPTSQDKSQNHLEQLMDILTSTPYIDRIQKPRLSVSKKNPQKIIALISLKEERYTQELNALLDERGYSCKIINTK